MMAADAVRCMQRSTGGGGDVVSARYWRLVFYQSPIGRYRLNELTLYDAADTDVSVGGVASASSQYKTWSPARAFDKASPGSGDFMTDLSLPGEWLCYDAGANVEVASIRITGAGAADYTPYGFDLEYSDDNSAWAVAISIRDEAAWGYLEERIFTL